MSKFFTTASANTVLKGEIEGRELERDDFKKVNLKGLGQRYYFSFREPYLQIEICLEPCLNGFDVGLYDTRYGELFGRKECTNLQKENIYSLDKVEKEYKKLTKKEREIFKGALEKEDSIHKTLERNSKAWTKGLQIANKVFRMRKNAERIKRWDMIEQGELGEKREGPISKPVPIPSSPPEVYPVPYIPPLNSKDFQGNNYPTSKNTILKGASA